MGDIEETLKTDGLPNHDFHSAWGSSYSTRSTLQDPQTRELWSQYLQSPSSVDRQYHVLLGAYTNLFAEFFNGYYPFSLHAHATDALLPTTIASLIANTVATSPLIFANEHLHPKDDEPPEETGSRIREFTLSLLGWTDVHIHAPTFITIDGTYGACFGPLAHISKEWEVRAIASGPRPVVVNLKTQPSFEEIDAQFAAAKAAGAIAVLFDMVTTEDGSVLSPAQYEQIKQAAQRNRLLIIVDETMTAIRCGAPFAFQRPEYNTSSASKPITDILQPDLVIFGKGLAVSGVAIGFEGVVTRSLMYTEPEYILQSILYWRALVSRPVGVPVLIQALGVLRIAAAENWPARSEAIGDAIRGILHDLEPTTRAPGAVRGLGAVIAIHRSVAMKYRIQSAIRRRIPWVRWLPKLDQGYANRDLLMQHVFGEESAGHRMLLSEEAEKIEAMPLWCFVCGIQATEEEWCRTCFLGVCGNEVCQAGFGTHVCVGK